jgi:hypothetical protein
MNVCELDVTCTLADSLFCVNAGLAFRLRINLVITLAILLLFQDFCADNC